MYARRSTRGKKFPHLAEVREVLPTGTTDRDTAPSLCVVDRNQDVDRTLIVSINQSINRNSIRSSARYKPPGTPIFHIRP